MVINVLAYTHTHNTHTHTPHTQHTPQFFVPSVLSTALAVETEVRSHGSIPATIGVLDGRVHVGMTAADLARLAEPSLQGRKISRRDLPYAISKVRPGYCHGENDYGKVNNFHHRYNMCVNIRRL